MARKSKSRPLLPVILMVAGGVLLISVAAFYLVNGLKPEPAPQPTSALQTSEIPRISLGDAKAAYDTGQAVFVDVRDANSYAAGHITGALSIPLAELADRAGELSPSDWIITY